MRVWTTNYTHTHTCLLRPPLVTCFCDLWSQRSSQTLAASDQHLSVPLSHAESLGVLLDGPHVLHHHTSLFNQTWHNFQDSFCSHHPQKLLGIMLGSPSIKLTLQPAALATRRSSSFSCLAPPTLKLYPRTATASVTVLFLLCWFIALYCCSGSEAAASVHSQMVMRRC